MRTKPLWPKLAGLAFALLPETSRAAEGGLPQLDIGTYAGQLFWLAVYFAVIYVFLWTVAIPRVSSILAERRARVGGDLDHAERLRGEADQAMKTYEATLAEAHAKARGLIAATHEKNTAALNEQTAAASKRFEQEVGQSLERIEAARRQALGGLRDVATGLAAEITAKVAGRVPSPESVSRAVDAAASAEAA